MPIYQIAVLQTNRDYFDYECEDESLVIGARVWVPFRQATKLGIVVGFDSLRTDKKGLKSILQVIDKQPIISEDIVLLCRWVAAYYQSPLALVLALALPKATRNGAMPERITKTYYELNTTLDLAHKALSMRATKQHHLIDYLQEHHTCSSSELVKAGFSQSVLTTLVEKNLLRYSVQPLLPFSSKEPVSPPLPLNDEQTLAYETIKASLNVFHCFLLYGVTGSGKTEVYFQIIADVLAQGKQVLVLVPEIGLTPQLRQRFESRFKEPMAVIHSQMNDTERQQAWLWARDEHAKIVIGTRSALFTMMPSLGLIIIDEEHDTSLKQMEGVRYLARDTALMRAHAAKIPIILGSATPSLESLANIEKGKYTLLRLTQKALNNLPLHYQIVDLRAQKLQDGLANATIAIIKRHLDDNNQVLVFINRRGFSPVLLCHLCGWKAVCPHCDAHLTIHKTTHQMICHHCGFFQKQVSTCPSCQGHELIFMGAGTQRIEESLQLLFPTTTLLRVDRDAVRKKHAFAQQLDQIHAGAAQLIIGTQMLAKGHHFSRLSLVVVLDADYGFYDQDFRALERLGQLLMQVAGRAGRADIPGEVVIQTHVPDHLGLQVLVQKGYEPFAKSLLELRKQASLPPFSYMALIRAQGRQQDKVLGLMHEIKLQLSTAAITVMGPAPAPLAKKASFYRMQLMLKSKSRQQLQASLTSLRSWLMTHKVANGLRWNIDVDPIDLS